MPAVTVFGGDVRAGTPTLAARPLPPLAQRAASPSAPLELAIEPRRRVSTVDVPANPRDWYPTHKKDYSFVGDAAKKLVVGIVVVGALFAAYRWYAGQQADDDAARAEAKATEQARLLRQAMGETSAGPGCDQPGAVWVYTDKHGADVIVDSLSKIPAKDRAKARCAVPSR